jgi:hypothetical protein
MRNLHGDATSVALAERREPAASCARPCQSPRLVSTSSLIRLQGPQVLDYVGHCPITSGHTEHGSCRMFLSKTRQEVGTARMYHTVLKQAESISVGDMT